MPRKRKELNEEMICWEYESTNIGIEAMAKKYHVGKLAIKDVLDRNGVSHKTVGGQNLKEEFAVNDWRIKKYQPVPGEHYVATDRATGYKTNDWENAGGFLTKHIRETYGVETPTLYDRRMYYMRTGNYWWEQWFDIVSEKDAETKKCAYCGWETVDTSNKSGVYEQHLNEAHGISKFDHLKAHPEDVDYFLVSTPSRRLQLEADESKFVVCRECGMKFTRLNNAHLAKHGLTRLSYVQKYSETKFLSDDYLKLSQDYAHRMNIALDGKDDKFESSAERDIRDAIMANGLECRKDRRVLDGKELDILVPEKGIAIEYNGLQWHSELFGKKGRMYHIEKMEQCKKSGIRLIQVFEDEYIKNRDLVMKKILHILGRAKYSRKAPARKCFVTQISSGDAKAFLDRNHIQGYVASTVHIGAVCDGRLAGVMSFSMSGGREWNLTRFATDIDTLCPGLGGKIFAFFKRNYEFDRVITFADRRWTTDEDDNLYTKIGFKKDSVLPPAYWYYNPRVSRDTRIHRFLLRKKNLMKMGNFPSYMTEWEMARSLGYDRIWDCGLVRYVYDASEKKEEKKSNIKH